MHFTRSMMIHPTTIIVFICISGLSIAQQETAKDTDCGVLPGCRECYDPGLLCYQCAPKRALRVDNTKCERCPPNCAGCTHHDSPADWISCDLCEPGYVRTAMYECKRCDVEECDVCVLLPGEEQSVCTTCRAPHYNGRYYTINPNKTCTECVAHCADCSATSWNSTQWNTECTSCLTGSALYPATKTCHPCSENCLQCSFVDGVLQCDTCKDRYLKNGDKHGTPCISCPPECTQCTTFEAFTGIAKCVSCIAAHFHSTPSCLPCGDKFRHCSECDMNSCTTCSEGYRPEGAGCEECTVLQCGKCDVTSVTCEDCTNGWGVKQHVTCDSCVTSECAVCEPDVWTCTQCVPQFMLHPTTKQCIACPTKCSSCTWDSVSSSVRCAGDQYCMDDFILNTDTHVCLKCPAGCSRAQCAYVGGAAQCLSCDVTTSPHVVVGGTCKPCQPHCTACDWVAATGLTVCTHCEAGYINDAHGICIECGSGCAACRAVGECTECLPGHTGPTYNHSCLSCTMQHPACVTCYLSGSEQTGVACNQCEAGWGVRATGCVRCVTSNCQLCSISGSDSTSTCITCLPGYVLRNAECVDCGAPCELCELIDYTIQCVQCPAHLAINPYNFGCDTCGLLCLQCTWDVAGSHTRCTRCAPGIALTLDPVSGECLPCPDLCATCSSVDGNAKCDFGGCIHGYGLNLDNICIKCPVGCADCSQLGSIMVCERCATTRRYNDQQCGACPPNCKECQDNAGTMQCSECMAGFALREGGTDCLACTANCQRGCVGKADHVVCGACRVGHALSIEKSQCVECGRLSSVPHCTNCTDADDMGRVTCHQCTGGYTLSDDAKTCLSNPHTLDGCVQPLDKPKLCSSCDPQYELYQGECVRHCYTCGIVDYRNGVMQAPPGELCNNSTVMFNITACAGSCWGFRYEQDGVLTTARGCYHGNCTSEGETCETVKGRSECQQCCGQSRCNLFIMDGVPDTGSHVTATYIIVMATSAAIISIWGNTATPGCL